MERQFNGFAKSTPHSRTSCPVPASPSLSAQLAYPGTCSRQPHLHIHVLSDRPKPKESNREKKLPCQWRLCRFAWRINLPVAYVFFFTDFTDETKGRTYLEEKQVPTKSWNYLKTDSWNWFWTWICNWLNGLTTSLAEVQITTQRHTWRPDLLFRSNPLASGCLTAAWRVYGPDFNCSLKSLRTRFCGSLVVNFYLWESIEPLSNYIRSNICSSQVAED